MRLKKSSVLFQLLLYISYFCLSLSPTSKSRTWRPVSRVRGGSVHGEDALLSVGKPTACFAPPCKSRDSSHLRKHPSSLLCSAMHRQESHLARKRPLTRNKKKGLLVRIGVRWYPYSGLSMIFQQTQLFFTMQRQPRRPLDIRMPQ